MKTSGRLAHSFSALLIAISSALGALGQRGDVGKELLETRVSDFEIRNGTVFGGIAELSAKPVELSFAFEYILTAHVGDNPISEVRFNIDLKHSTFREILTALCSADSRYTWTRDGTTVNVFPKDTVGNRSYLMNRVLPKLELHGVSSAEEAMFAAVKQLPPPFEQVAFVQAGGVTSLPIAWTVNFDNLTLRQALNLIAGNMAPHGGWVLSGSHEFRAVGFHTQRIHDALTHAE